MATHPSNVATLIDVAKGLDPDGSPAKVIEILTETNEVLEDVQWKQGNLPTGHRTTIRTGLPDVYWRLINQGTPPSKAKTEQVDESCAMLEAWAEVDEKLVKLNGNSAAYRLGQSKPFIQAMNNEFNTKLFYGDEGSDARVFTGLEPRYSDSSAESAENVVEVDTSPADGRTSLWLACWGENTGYGIYPQGSQAGLEHEDLGRQVVESAAGLGNGNRLMAYRDRFSWDCGLVVEDWRYFARAANIDVEQLHTNANAADLRSAMVKMLWAIPDLAMGRCAFYGNRTALQALDLQGTFAVSGSVSSVGTDVPNKFNGSGLGPAGSYAQFQGATQGNFRGVPVKRCDAITCTETEY